MIELDNFGWNVLTVTFIATLLLSIVGWFGLLKQYLAIQRSQSVERLSTIWILVFAAAVASNLSYGLERESLAMLGTFSLRMPWLVLILIAIYRLRGFRLVEVAVFVSIVIALFWMAISPSKGIFFAILSGAGAVALADQPWQIWRKKSVGVVSVELLLISLISSCFWLIYGVMTSDWPLTLTASTYVAVSLVAVGLWFHFRRPVVASSRTQVTFE